MIGFEIEISLLVVDGSGAKLAGESKLAQCPKVPLKIVSDNRQGYSNLEFVTEPVAVTGSNSGTGPGILMGQVDSIKGMRDALYAARPGSFATAITPFGNPVEHGVNAQIIDFPHNYTPAEDDGSDGLFLHYSVGVPFRSLAGFFDLLRQIAPFNSGHAAFLDRARFRTLQAADIATAVAKDFASNGATSQQSVDIMQAYMQLVYTQIAGVADYTSEKNESGQVKNTTVALSRTSFYEIYPALPLDVRTYLGTSWTNQTILERIADYQDKTETGSKANFNENVIRSVPTFPPFSLKQYLQSALTGAPKVPQSSMFGKMTLIPPTAENGVDLIVFELRTMGSRYKTWAQVKQDLQLLATWVQKA
jgi:hypothetical protein